MSRSYYYSRTRSYPKKSSKNLVGLWIFMLLLIALIYLSTSTNILGFVYSNQYPYTTVIDVTDKMHGQ